MKLDENILKTCQGLVMNCNCLERTIICDHKSGFKSVGYGNSYKK